MKTNKPKQKKVEKNTTKKKYIPPQVLSLGDIRDVTMGGSPGAGDSSPGLPTNPF